MWWILGKYSTRIPSVLGRLCPKFFFVMNSLNHVNLSSQTVFDCGFWFTFPRHNTESGNTQTVACERLMTSSSLNGCSCFRGKFSQLIWDTPKISSDCSNITFSDISKICFKVRFHLYFLMDCKLSEKFFPTNTDASNVEDINIHQIIERLSMSCTASSGERFNIFRNRSLTLFKNDRDFR